jgi:hypothetical protein
MFGRIKNKRLGGVTTVHLLLMLSVALVATGCGGDSAPGTSTTATLSAGQVTQSNSIIVNGTHFETEGAELEFENESPEIISGDDSAIRDGMLAEIRGPVDDSTGNGTATSIRIEDTVEGPVLGDGGVAAETTPGLIKELNVLGQSVILENGFTLFDAPLAFSTDFTGVTLEVHGPIITNADGSTTVQATYVEEKPANGILEVKGFATNVLAGTFEINGLTVAFDPGNALVEVPSEGDLVEVKGAASAFTQPPPTLTATSVEVEGGFEDIAEAEIEGFVANLTATTFMIRGQLVDFSGNPTFRGGIAADLVERVKVEAEGPILGGTLIAEKITFKESVRIEDNAAGAIVGNSVTLEGLGLTVIINDQITDNRISPADPLVAGDGLRIRGRLTGANQDSLVGIRIEKVSPNNQVELQGPVGAINRPMVTIVGIDVDTSTISEVDPSGSNFEIEDVKVTADQFFAALSVGDIAKARADLPAPLVWDQIELELEDDN